jgi:hypothetical protein
MQHDRKTEKTFLRYVQMREGVAVSTAGADQLGGIEATEVKELLRLVWDRYKPELKDFISDLGSQNDDQDLQDLLKKLDGSGKDMSGFGKDMDKDEVVPAFADSGGDDESGND